MKEGESQVQNPEDTISGNCAVITTGVTFFVDARTNRIIVADGLHNYCTKWPTCYHLFLAADSVSAPWMTTVTFSLDVQLTWR